jgi:hypothetical protein
MRNLVQEGMVENTDSKTETVSSFQSSLQESRFSKHLNNKPTHLFAWLRTDNGLYFIP